MDQSMCPHDYENPECRGKLRYHCRKCGANITLDIVCLVECEMRESELEEKKQNNES